MKCLVVLTIALLATVVADDEWKPPIGDGSLHQIHEKCVKESGLTGEQLERINKFERPDESEVHEYVLCCVKKLEVFTDDGGYSADRLMATFTTMRLDLDKAREIVEKCVDSNEQKSTTAAWAFRGMECMMANKMDELLREAQDKLRNNAIEDGASI